MSSNLDYQDAALLDPYPRDPTTYYTAPYMAPRSQWPVADMGPFADERRQSPPIQQQQQQQYQQQQQQQHQQHQQHQQQAPPSHHNSPTLLTEWPMQSQIQHQQVQQHSQQLQQYIQESALMGSQFNAFNTPYHHPAPMDYGMPTTQASLEASLQMEAPFGGMQTAEAQAMQWGVTGMANWQDFENAMSFAQHDGLPGSSLSRQSLGSNSPTGTYLEVLSIPSSSSDSGWAAVETYRDFSPYQQHNAAIFNPGQTLHLRTHSDSSQSDGTRQSIDTLGSYEEISYPPYSPYSPASDTYIDVSHRNCYHHGDAHQHNHSHSHEQQHYPQQQHSHEVVTPTPAIPPQIPIKVQPQALTASPTSTSSVVSQRATPSTTSSPPAVPARRNSGPRRSLTAITAPTTNKVIKATAIRRSTNPKEKGDTEKKVGRRKGPLRPEQRKQASEIRKLRACLRCKFLKKTCDTGEPCAGCQPSHARLWQVPCTRIDIKDIGNFMKDWKGDYERHVGLGVSVYNIKGFAIKEELMWITHGYGFALPIMAREVYVTDESCFTVDWMETDGHRAPVAFDTRTERMSAGAEGISTSALSEYLDKHIDNSFEDFIDDYFEGTPFITEILKTAYRFYTREKLPIIRKALKLVLAYNLTMHITMIERQGDQEEEIVGLIDNEDSKWRGRVVAPVMINFQVKCALADTWRSLQSDILSELSSLYSSVYSGDRLKNWPTIFILASILLAVWEEMQFDCHYRVPDEKAVEKFCNDMESTPVGVIVGLFHAISQKAPRFEEWETRRHGGVLGGKESVCVVMEEMKGHVTKHEDYLKARAQSTCFDREDFDSLSNKFLSKLVIRAN